MKSTNARERINRKESYLMFELYQGAADSSEDRMPQPFASVSTMNARIGGLLTRYQEFTRDPDVAKQLYPWADRFVMGIPLPAWQRPSVWTLEQKQRFIASVWAEVDLGTFLVNSWFEYADAEHVGTQVNSDCLLDGQQRLTAIQEFITNGFWVPDGQGQPRYWRDLTRTERRRFASMKFAEAHIKSGDEAVLRMVYDLRAFGGTPHEASQRASGAVDG